MLERLCQRALGCASSQVSSKRVSYSCCRSSVASTFGTLQIKFRLLQSYDAGVAYLEIGSLNAKTLPPTVIRKSEYVTRLDVHMITSRTTTVSSSRPGDSLTLGKSLGEGGRFSQLLGFRHVSERPEGSKFPSGAACLPMARYLRGVTKRAWRKG